MKKHLTRPYGLVNNYGMTIIENIYEAKTHFSRLIDRAIAGDEVIIARSGHPVVCIVPYRAPLPARRKPGSAVGEFQMTADFDAPLSEEELQDWGS